MSDADLGYIHPKLRQFARPISSLKLDEENARAHPKRNLEEIRDSLKKHGQTRLGVVIPRDIVIHAGGKAAPAGTIIIGNGMTLAAMELGWTHIAVIDFEGEDGDAAQLALRDNRSGDLAEWEYKQLSMDLSWLKGLQVDLGSLGWLDHEAGPLMAADWTPSPAAGFQQPEQPQSGIQGRTGGVHGEHRAGIHLSTEQRETVDRAIAAARAKAGGNMTDGEALVVICNAFMTGTRRARRAPSA